MKLNLVGQIIVWALIAGLTAFVLWMVGPFVYYFAPSGGTRFIPFILPALVLGFILTARRLSTEARHRWGLLFLLSCSLSLLLSTVTFPVLNGGDPHVVGLVFLLAPGFYAFRLPSRLWTIIPLGIVLLSAVRMHTEDMMVELMVLAIPLAAVSALGAF